MKIKGYIVENNKTVLQHKNNVFPNPALSSVGSTRYNCYWQIWHTEVLVSSLLPHGCISWLTHFLTFLAALHKAVTGSKFIVRRDRSHQVTYSWMSMTMMSGKKRPVQRISRNRLLFFSGSIKLGYVYSFQTVVFKLLSSYPSYSTKGNDVIGST